MDLNVPFFFFFFASTKTLIYGANSVESCHYKKAYMVSNICLKCLFNPRRASLALSRLLLIHSFSDARRLDIVSNHLTT